MSRMKMHIVLVVLTLFSGLVLSSISTHAETSGVTTAAITVPIACTMQGTGTTHTATLAPNTYSGASGSEYENGIGKTTLTAICNDDNGFAIYAIGYTGDSYDASDHTKLVGNATGGTINTAVYASGDTTSSWSMKLIKIADATESYNPQNLTISTGYDVWHAVPDVYTKVAQYKANTGSSTTDLTLGVKLETTYAAFIAPNQSADTYVGKVKYTMVHPYDAAEPVVCKPQGTTISTIVCMQDISSTNKSSILTSMTEGTQYTLYDVRDEKPYMVAKLADGNIWMTQNLDLDLDENVTLTNENTDIGWNASTSSYDTVSWTPERSTYPTGTTTWSLYDEVDDIEYGWFRPESYDPGDVYWNGTLAGNSDWTAYSNSCSSVNGCDESLNPFSTFTTVAGTPISQYHFGNFYNWTAAVAMNDSSSYYSRDYDVNQSICPSGWMLPKVNYTNNTGSVQYLVEQYGWNSASNELSNGNKVYQTPMYFALNGQWVGNTFDTGYEGFLWSSTVYEESEADGTWSFASGRVYPRYNLGRSFGLSVRCLVR